MDKKKFEELKKLAFENCPDVDPDNLTPQQIENIKNYRDPNYDPKQAQEIREAIAEEFPELNKYMRQIEHFTSIFMDCFNR